MTITNVRDIRGENINWKALGKRFKKFRKARHLTRWDAAQVLGITDSMVSLLENGRERKSTNIIWLISFQWNLSLNWLLNGLGKPHDSDPLELMPETLTVQKGVGIRRNFTRVQAEEGNFTDHLLEFVMAIDKFKIKNKVTFPSFTQIYEIITALGYRKSVPARIAPLGYIVEHQQWAEELKQMNETIEASFDWTDKELHPEACETPNHAVKRILPSQVRYNIKRRKKRQEAIKNDNTLSETEKQRRLKIGQRTRIRGKRFILTDSEGRQHLVKNLAQFCHEHQLMPAHMYAVAAEQRKQHKGWKAKVAPE